MFMLTDFCAKKILFTYFEQTRKNLMNYQNYQEKFINKVYHPYMNGDFGQARQQLRAMYLEGKAHPRAVLMQTAGCIKKINKQQKVEIEKLKLEGKNTEKNEIFKRYVNFLSEIKDSEHPLLKKAQNELEKALDEIYKNPKNKNFSRFILAKQSIPFLGKLKFLAKFF